MPGAPRLLSPGVRWTPEEAAAQGAPPPPEVKPDRRRKPSRERQPEVDPKATAGLNSLPASRWPTSGPQAQGARAKLPQEPRPGGPALPMATGAGAPRAAAAAPGPVTARDRLGGSVSRHSRAWHKESIVRHGTFRRAGRLPTYASCGFTSVVHSTRSPPLKTEIGPLAETTNTIPAICLENTCAHKCLVPPLDRCFSSPPAVAQANSAYNK